MRKIAVVVVAVLASMGLSTSAAHATSPVVAHGNDWGRIVDGPNGPNTLVYACDGEDDGHYVYTRYTLKHHTGWPSDYYEVHAWYDTDGPNNGCEGVDLTIAFGDQGFYAQSLSVCEAYDPNPCTNFYNTNP